MLFTILFVMLYLAPVLPVARRIEYVRTRPRKIKTTPDRKITRALQFGYVWVNNSILQPQNLCNNCGGGKEVHPKGAHEILNNNSSDNYNVCHTFVVWDQKTREWSGVTIWRDDSPKVATSILIALALWLPLVIAESAKHGWNAAGFEPQKFAVPYHGVESLESKVTRLEREAEVREQAIERLETLNGITNIKEIA